MEDKKATKSPEYLDDRIKAVADGLEKAKTMQARKFGEANPAKPSVEDRQETHDAITNKQEEATGVDFGQVLVAIKEGKTASRLAWKGTIVLLPAQNGEGKTVGMNFKQVNGNVGRAQLHTNDLLATDWEIH